VAVFVLVEETCKQFDGKGSLLADRTRHLQVQVPDELDRVCQDVSLHFLQVDLGVMVEEVKSLTQDHREQVLDVEVRHL